MQAAKFVFGVALILFTFGSTAQAATLTYNFTGVVTSLSNNGDFSSIPNFSAGVVPNVTTVTGSFSFDTLSALVFEQHQPNPSVHLDFAEYAATGNVVINFASGELSWSGVRSLVFSYDEFGLDEFVVAKYIEGLPLNQIRSTGGLVFDDFTHLIFDETVALPTGLTLSDWSRARFYVDMIFYEGPNGYGQRYVEGSITSLELATPQVPLPAALPLLAAGIGAMGFMGWRRKHKQSAKV